MARKDKEKSTRKPTDADSPARSSKTNVKTEEKSKEKGEEEDDNGDKKNVVKSKSIFDAVSGTTTEVEEDDFVKIDLIMPPMHVPPPDPDSYILSEYVTNGQLIKAKAKLKSMAFEEFQRMSTYSNFQGDTILHTAVRRQDESMVELLLNELIHLEPILYDCLLVAAKESNVEIAEKILRTIRKTPGLAGTQQGRLSSLPKWKNSEFDDHMTPLLLAAIAGNYDLIALFSQAGEKLQTQFLYDDPNKEMSLWKKEQMKRRGSGWTELDKRPWSQQRILCCFYENDTVQEDMKIGYQRLHEYQAVTSPEFLCWCTMNRKGFDPIDRIFHFLDKLKQVQRRELELYDEYQACIDQLKEFMVQLVAVCNSTLEIEILLTRNPANQYVYDIYPRVCLAMEMGLEDFVSHPHVQRCLYLEWSGREWSEWRYMPMQNKLWNFFSRLVLLPLFLIYVFVDRSTETGRQLASPLSTCIFHCSSQIIFVGLLIAEMLTELKNPTERRPQHIGLQITISLFVAGQIRSFCRQAAFEKKHWFRVAWNYYDLCMLLSLTGCISCWVYIYYIDLTEMTAHYMANGKSENIAEVSSRKPMNRGAWPPYDPLLLADLFLAIGTTMSCGKLLKFAYLNSVIGPIQVALGKGVKSIASFIFLFVTVFAAFGLGMTIIYAPYRGLKNTTTNQTQSEVYTEILSAIKELYWNLFGMASTESSELVPMNVSNSSNPSQMVNYPHYVTETAGKVLASVYSFFGPTIVFSSMLVGYITNRFGEIIERNDINWRFHRARIWIQYFREDVMPPPLNLLPSLWGVLKFCRACNRARAKPNKYMCTCNFAICFHYKHTMGPNERNSKDEVYANLMKLLVQRYFRSKRALEAKTTASSEDIATLNEEVEELRELVDQTNQAFQKLSESSSGKKRPPPAVTSPLSSGFDLGFSASESEYAEQEDEDEEDEQPSDLEGAGGNDDDDDDNNGGGGELEAEGESEASTTDFEQRRKQKQKRFGQSKGNNNGAGQTTEKEKTVANVGVKTESPIKIAKTSGPDKSVNTPITATTPVRPLFAKSPPKKSSSPDLIVKSPPNTLVPPGPGKKVPVSSSQTADPSLDPDATKSVDNKDSKSRGPVKFTPRSSTNKGQTPEGPQPPPAVVPPLPRSSTTIVNETEGSPKSGTPKKFSGEKVEKPQASTPSSKPAEVKLLYKPKDKETGKVETPPRVPSRRLDNSQNPTRDGPSSTRPWPIPPKTNDTNLNGQKPTWPMPPKTSPNSNGQQPTRPPPPIPNPGTPTDKRPTVPGKSSPTNQPQAPPNLPNTQGGQQNKKSLKRM